MIGARKAGLGVNRPAPADEFARAVAVAIADARRRLTQEEAERGAWTGNAGFADCLHRGSLPVAGLDHRPPKLARP
jgi:hypothetical protein